MDDIANDIRFAARQLLKRPGFTLIALLTFGIGIGATTTFFSIVNSFILREPAFPEADRLVLVHGIDTERGWTRTGVALRDLTVLREQTPALGSAAAFRESAFNLGIQEPERVRGAAVSADFFGLMGSAPTLGRGFLPGEAQANGDRVVVLGHRLWEERFGSDAEVLGRSVLLDGNAHTVIGVAPDRFDYPSGVSLWVPLSSASGVAGEDRSLQVIARLTPGATVGQAEQQLQAASRALSQERPATHAHWTAAVTPLRTAVGTKFGGAAVALLAAAAIVLLIACANLANLHLALMSARAQEIGLRAALGATRGRIARLLVTEGLVLSVIGGALGVLIAQVGIDTFMLLMGEPVGISASEFEISIDHRVLLFALTLAISTGLISSLGAALRSSRVDLRGTLQMGSRGAGTGVSDQRLRRWLVAAQIALSLPLVIGASSVMLSSFGFEKVHPGFDPRGILALRVTLAGDAYDTPEERVALVEQLLPRLEAMAGVEAVTAASHVPLINRNDVPWTTFEPDGWDLGSGNAPATSIRYAVPGYHQAMGIPMSRGRSFTQEEGRASAPGAVVVNQTLAERFWPDRDPVGQRIRLAGGAPDEWHVVVGVAGDVMQRGLPAAPENQLYLPYAQSRDLTFVIRSQRDATALLAEARAITRALDPALPLYEARTMDDAFRWFTRDRVSQAMVLGGLGGVALLLALLGVYGVMAFTVAQRTREFGIRLALGGQSGDVLRTVLRPALLLLAVGTGVGLVLALALSRLLAAVFPNIPPFQPLLFAAVASLLALSVLLASWGPARRATRADPMVALRTD